jgi:nitroreductase
MTMLECIKKRRSVRRYTDRDVSDEVVLKLVDAARHAPFGGPCEVEPQLFEFIIIREPAIKKALAHENKEREFIMTAPVIIACCADITKDPNYRDYDITVALGAENLMLAATSMGLGTCYVTSYGNHVAHEKERKILRETLKLPDHIRLVSLITLGYPDEVPPPKPLRDLADMLHYEYWGVRQNVK